MTQDDLNLFKQWFSEYCRSFYSSNIEDQKNISLKEEHTLHVCKNMVQIAQGLSPKEDQKLIVETVTLFHDIGRFPQYAKYKTFRDNISVNHGVLGAETLIEKNILEKLAGEEQKIIIQAVKFHNAFSMPSVRISNELNSCIYYLTFTVRNWYYIFDRHNRFQILADSLKHCQKHKGLKIYAYVLRGLNLFYEMQNIWFKLQT